MCASPRNVIIPPTPPTHPTDHPHSSMCATHHIRRLVCVHVLGTPTPPNLQRYVCVCVQLGMYASPRYVTIPTHPPNPKVCVCVRTVGNVCKSKVCYHPQPTHPPTQPKGMCVCVRTVGNVCKSKVCYHPHPTHPPTHHPPNPKVCVYRWVPKNTLCVQMSQICVRRWGFWSVCTDESNLCAQMSPLPYLLVPFAQFVSGFKGLTLAQKIGITC